ncbi:MAG: hypothetical protein N3D84_02235 [Candidatus Woesearchaeota archaeon]|nr:hypothetical protein [Candidatus Woesearchaeota archaeon]
MKNIWQHIIKPVFDNSFFRQIPELILISAGSFAGFLCGIGIANGIIKFPYSIGKGALILSDKIKDYFKG